MAFSIKLLRDSDIRQTPSHSQHILAPHPTPHLRSLDCRCGNRGVVMGRAGTCCGECIWPEQFDHLARTLLCPRHHPSRSRQRRQPAQRTTTTHRAGTRAERELRPGSGTKDIVLGIASRHALGLSDALIVQASVNRALYSREELEPGTRNEISASGSPAFTQNFGGVVPLNLRHRTRDSGAQSEPANPGSTSMDMSSSLTASVGHASTLHAYVQVPIYQKVNGIQPVPRSSLAVGWTSVSKPQTSLYSAVGCDGKLPHRTECPWCTHKKSAPQGAFRSRAQD